MERGNLLPSTAKSSRWGLVAVPSTPAKDSVRDLRASQGAPGRDSYREGQSSSPAAPEAPTRGLRDPAGARVQPSWCRCVPSPCPLRSLFVLLYAPPIMPPRWRANPDRGPCPGPVCRLRAVRATRAVRRGEAHAAIRLGRQAHRSAPGAYGGLP
jgi:hypothetical protein